jgi:hypothetical protein
MAKHRKTEGVSGGIFFHFEENDLLGKTRIADESRKSIILPGIWKTFSKKLTGRHAAANLRGDRGCFTKAAPAFVTGTCSIS